MQQVLPSTEQSCGIQRMKQLAEKLSILLYPNFGYVMRLSDSDSPNSVENIVAAVGTLLPAELSENFRKNFLNSVKAALENMDFVTRSEIEVQETVLRRAQVKIKELEARIAQLESESETRSPATPSDG